MYTDIQMLQLNDTSLLMYDNGNRCKDTTIIPIEDIEYYEFRFNNISNLIEDTKITRYYSNEPIRIIGTNLEDLLNKTLNIQLHLHTWKTLSTGIPDKINLTGMYNTEKDIISVINEDLSDSLLEAVLDEFNRINIQSKVSSGNVEIKIDFYDYVDYSLGLDTDETTGSVELYNRAYFTNAKQEELQFLHTPEMFGLDKILDGKIDVDFIIRYTTGTYSGSFTEYAYIIIDLYLSDWFSKLAKYNWDYIEVGNRELLTTEKELYKIQIFDGIVKSFKEAVLMGDYITANNLLDYINNFIMLNPINDDFSSTTKTYYNPYLGQVY
jgi:hypothetical protein